jgi:hypothetical protein
MTTTRHDELEDLDNLDASEVWTMSTYLIWVYDLFDLIK